MTDVTAQWKDVLGVTQLEKDVSDLRNRVDCGPSLKQQWLEAKQKELKERYPHVGEFFEINGFLFRVRKLGTKGDVVLRRFTGAIEVPKVNATATMVAGAKKV